MGEIVREHHGFEEELCQQFRIYAVLSNYSLKHAHDQFEAEGEPFLHHALRLLLFYLRNIKEIGIAALRDAMTLIAILYNLEVRGDLGSVGRTGHAVARRKGRV